MVLNELSFSSLLENNKLVFVGNGASKAGNVIEHPNALFLSDIKPVAVDMMALSERAFRNSDFIDVAYSTPIYLKEFHAIKPKNKLFEV